MWVRRDAPRGTDIYTGRDPDAPTTQTMATRFTRGPACGLQLHRTGL